MVLSRRAAFTPLAGLVAALLGLGSTGCAGAVDVTRTFTPNAASRISTDAMHPVAIVRGEERIALPPGSRVEVDRVLVAPRVVRGVERPAHEIALEPTDGIEMRGKVEPGEVIPGGGRVESSRATGWLGAGLVVTALSYAPTLYVGLTSSDPYDKALQIPFAGPWMDFLSRPACVPPNLPVALPVDPCMADKASRAAIVTSGAMQDLGALFVLVGLPASAHIVGDADHGVGLSVVPTSNGAKLIGTF
jgi:hypothetical protein